MAKKRLALTFSLLLIVATLVIIATVFAVRYFRDYARSRPAAPLPPVEAPNTQAPIPEVPKPKEVEKPKEPAKPPKKPEPQAKVEEDMTGKVRLCPNSREAVALSSDGRLLGHYPYADANASDLGSTPSGFGSGSCSMLHGEAKVALDQMIEGARASDPAIADAMIGLSCFRSAKYQREVFCRKVGDGMAARARASAPPGYSEHATGYVIDFGDHNNAQCNLNNCFATTPVGEWLSANAGKYGYVLSFPKGNAQGVMYEPWHWRYQGSPASQALFAGRS
jgi:zinc D-Ala-D-Ala carboxypeptidase